MIATSNLEPWQEFGLAGLVIGALFALVAALLRIAFKKDRTFVESVEKKDAEFLKSIEQKDAAHTQFLREMLEGDREERARQDQSRSEADAKLAEALKDLTTTIAKSRTAQD